MDNIKVKIKEKHLTDAEILKRKNFSSSFNQYQAIKSSYAKIAGMWGATIGIIVFIGMGSMKLMDSNHEVEKVNISQDQRMLSNNPYIEVKKDITESTVEESFEEEKPTETAIKTESKTSTKTKAEKSKIEVVENTTTVIESPEKKESIPEIKTIDLDYLPED